MVTAAQSNTIRINPLNILKPRLHFLVGDDTSILFSRTAALILKSNCPRKVQVRLTDDYYCQRHFVVAEDHQTCFLTYSMERLSSCEAESLLISDKITQIDRLFLQYHPTFSFAFFVNTSVNNPAITKGSKRDTCTISIMSRSSSIYHDVDG